MQPLTTLRTLALASMLALSIASPLAVHAQPREGGASGVDRRPDNATCVFVSQGFYDCTTPDGGEWYCTNDTDPDACVNVKLPNRTQVGSQPIIRHPILGGVFDPVTTDPTPTPRTPRLPSGVLYPVP
jgi:hypothetical protein